MLDSIVYYYIWWFVLSLLVEVWVYVLWVGFSFLTLLRGNMTFFYSCSSPCISLSLSLVLSDGQFKKCAKKKDGIICVIYMYMCVCIACGLCIPFWFFVAGSYFTYRVREYWIIQMPTYYLPFMGIASLPFHYHFVWHIL